MPGRLHGGGDRCGRWLSLADLFEQPPTRRAFRQTVCASPGAPMSRLEILPARGPNDRRAAERELLTKATTGTPELRPAWWLLYVAACRERDRAVRP